jgi:glycosyltransferase involved in cell wall biosynthesis
VTQSSRLELLSVIVPAFNEEKVLPAFHRRLVATLELLPFFCEIIYINDGSKDDTLEILRGILDEHDNVAVVNLSRNFGKEIAVTAGLDHASGDAVVVIDADLQDPPELIPDLVRIFKESDADVIYAQRVARCGETAMKRLTAHLFYRVMNRISSIEMPVDTGDFRLMSRRAVAALLQLREHHRFMKGLYAWIGFRQIAYRYERDPRFAGDSKFSYWRLWNFSIEGLTSFTIAPLKIATYIGIIAAACAAVYGTAMIIGTLIWGNPVPGYPSLLAVTLLLGGLQLMTLGIIGEYLGRVFNEAKQRPLYFVQEYWPCRDVKGKKPSCRSVNTRCPVGRSSNAVVGGERGAAKN